MVPISAENRADFRANLQGPWAYLAQIWLQILEDMYL